MHHSTFGYVTFYNRVLVLDRVLVCVIVRDRDGDRDGVLDRVGETEGDRDRVGDREGVTEGVTDGVTVGDRVDVEVIEDPLDGVPV